MEFKQPLEILLSNQNTCFEYYRKQVSCETVTCGEQKGEIIGVSSDATVTFNFGVEEHQDYTIKNIKNIKLLNDNLSIKDKICDMVYYKVAEHVIYTLNSDDKLPDIQPLSAENRKKYLHTSTDPAKKVEISENILKMKAIVMDDSLRNALITWLDANANSLESKTPVNPTGSSTTPLFLTTDDLLSLLNAFRMLWINYVSVITIDHDEDTKMDGNEEKTYSSYMEWDNWSIAGTAPKSSTGHKERAKDIYLKYLWPHCFHGPYYKSLNSSSNREWKCKKCRKSAANKVVEWYKENGTISTKCNICGTICDPSCALERGADLNTCNIAGSGGKCNKCTHAVDDHVHIGWKCRELVKDNNVTEKGRIKYYKTKRTVFTFEICHSCIDSALKAQAKKEKQKVVKVREKRKKRRKNEGKKQSRPVSPQDKAPSMDFKNIVINATGDYKAKRKRPLSEAKRIAVAPVAPVERVVLTRQMRSDVSVRCALCIIPPKELWPTIQAIRVVHDPAYVRWMPHLNIFFPFIDENHFGTISKYIQEEIVNRNNIKAFDISLSIFDVFNRVKHLLSSRGSRKVETMFLNPSGCAQEMQHLFECLRDDWTVCANKHGGGFSPHLTVGKFKMNEMLNYIAKFQTNWESLSWKCDAIYLISRRGNDPFVIRHKISLC